MSVIFFKFKVCFRELNTTDSPQERFNCLIESRFCFSRWPLSVMWWQTLTCETFLYRQTPGKTEMQTWSVETSRPHRLNARLLWCWLKNHVTTSTCQELNRPNEPFRVSQLTLHMNKLKFCPQKCTFVCRRDHVVSEIYPLMVFICFHWSYYPLTSHLSGCSGMEMEMEIQDFF